MSILNIIFSISASLVFVSWYAISNFKNSFWILLITLLLFCLTFIPAIFFSGKIYDLSYDGQAYHQEAIVQLTHGWNPVYKTLEHEATANLERWLNHYPKAVWILSTGIYELTGNIESGKAPSMFIGILAVAYILWALWKVQIPLFFKILGSIVLSINPVFIYQSLSFYLDGIMVSLLLSLIAICFKILTENKKRYIYPFLSVFIVLLNIKLSAPVFAFIIVGGFISYLWLNNRPFPALRLVKYLFIGSLIGLVMVGYNPYITNFARYGHPLYPAMGKNAYDYVPMNTPENYWKIPPVARLFSSIFSVSSLARGQGQFAKFKIPFTFTSEELDAFHETNAKTGGFGPEFGGIFAFTITAVLIYFVFDWGKHSSIKVKEPEFNRVLFSSKKVTSEKIGLLFIILAIIGSASLVDTSSVARFVPYVWWFPGIAALFLASRRNIYGVSSGFLILFLSIFNLTLIASSYFPYNISGSEKLKKQLETIHQKQSSLPMKIDFAQFGSTKLKLANYQIRYEEVYSFTSCTKRKRILMYNISELCETP